jgi:hypothetical protein
MYHGRVPIPALAMVDDVVNIATCNSIQSLKNNVETDEFIKMKKMEGQVGDGKCQWLHVGKNECHSSYVIGGTKTTQCQVYKYLGDHTSDGWEPLYKKRCERAHGYSASCMAMCTEITLGYQVYITAKMLHQAIFLNGVLVNMETWPHFTNNRIIMFEKVEQGLLRKILGAHSKTPIECLYLEFGIPPFRFQLMTRRILYFHGIMKRDNDELTRKVVTSQMERNTKGDFYSQVVENMEQLDMQMEEIMLISKTSLKDLLAKKVLAAAFSYLIDLAQSHSKVNEKSYENLCIAQYLNDSRFTPDLVNTLFKFRTRMYNVRNNFRNNYLHKNILCPLCEQTDDTQQHLFICETIRNQLPTPSLSNHDDIFSSDINTLLVVAKELKVLIETRQRLLEEMDEVEDTMNS